MNETNHDIEQKVMAEIKSGRVKLRSKYVFLAEKLGLGSALALSILLAVLFFNLVLFYLKESVNLWYLSFGSRGLFAFWESFPYPLVIGFVLLIFVAGFIIKKTGTLYKKPFGRLALILSGVVVLFGFILTFTTIAEEIEKRALNHRPGGMFFRPFLHPGLDERQKGIVGQVIKVGRDFIEIQTPRDIKRVDLTDLELPLPKKLQEGMFIMAVGDKDGGVFKAHALRVIDEQGMPMIRRGIHERFPPGMPLLPR